ncbi:MULTISPECIES: hypothetical protein [unclassified Moorena]|uniref:hypothetical protein n=1 Tax=unclassified Moorena TaxID=2683338 RepID=UPI0013FFAFFB|nr:MULTISPECIES: hypothetical protein [unclassified Moorena]NEO13674.1 hypothetical protein [Moorena sp. SIO3E8]NEQ03311.1 hypothetical protein [Moorena sp. SIO3F7]
MLAVSRQLSAVSLWATDGATVRASWWNGHLGGMGILVEWASWWNGHLGGTGILVELASWWNGHLAWNWHLASFNLFSGGQDAHSTGIDPAGRMPTLLLFILFPIPDSRLPTPKNHKTLQRHNLAGIHDILLSGGRRI